MADPNDPKKETVRIDLPPPVAKPPDPTTKSRETVRIQLPIRQPSDTASLRPPTGPPLVSTPIDQDLRSPQFFQPPPTSSPVSPPKPPTVSVPLPPPAPVPVTPAADLPSSGPKKETARIAGQKSEYSIAELGAAADLLVVAGGDGTILRVVGQLAANRHATHRPPEPFNLSGAGRGKYNAAVLGASRRLHRHFDYSDLDLPFLKQWTIPPPLILMNPISTAK